MASPDVQAVAQAFHDGFAAQDTEGLSALYHDDARFLPPNMPPVEGRSAIRAAFEQLMDMGVRGVDIEPIDVREGGDLTVEYGRYTLHLEPPGGERISDVGKYVVVYESRDGSAKIILDCFNSNSPPPG